MKPAVSASATVSGTLFTGGVSNLSLWVVRWFRRSWRGCPSTGSGRTGRFLFRSLRSVRGEAALRRAQGERGGVLFRSLRSVRGEAALRRAQGERGGSFSVGSVLFVVSLPFDKLRANGGSFPLVPFVVNLPFDGLRANGGFFSAFPSVRGEPVEPLFFLDLANRDTSSQFPRIMASFFPLLHPLIWRSALSASSRLGKVWEKTRSTGRRLKV